MNKVSFIFKNALLLSICGGVSLAIGSKQDEDNNHGYISNESQNLMLNQKTENAENQLTIDFSDSNSFDLFKKTY